MNISKTEKENTEQRRERERVCKMAEGSSSTDIQRILAAIKSSEASFFLFLLSLFLFLNYILSLWSQILGFYVQIVEDRVQLFSDLGRIELKNVSESDYASVINCLVVSFFAFFPITLSMHVNSKRVQNSVIAFQSITCNILTCQMPYQFLF